jgi:spore coat-associated protein N
MARLPDLSRAQLALAINAAMALVAFALAFAAPGEGAVRMRLAGADGSVQLSNSKAGQAVFTAADMRPGGETRGTVRIGNTGTDPGVLRLTRVQEAETPGAGGGLLSRQLTLQVIDVSVPASPVAVYYGPLSAMGELSLGRISPGLVRTYEFIATLPGAADDNAYQGATLTSGFAWDATAIDGGGGTATPVPTTTPQPTTTPEPAVTAQPTVVATPAATATPVPVPAPTPSTTAVVTGDQVFAMPDARKCVSRRRFSIHLRRPKGFVLKTLAITVNGRTKVKVAGAKARRFRAKVNLRGLPAGRVRVKITATSTAGGKLVSKRTYHTCAKKAAKKKPKKKRRQRRSTPPSRS